MTSSKNKLCVAIFGMGYVGCVTAACLAEDGHQVIGLDISDVKLRALQAGESPVDEPGLNDLTHKVLSAGYLRSASNVVSTIREADVSFICVGTPSTDNGGVDLCQIGRVCEQIGEALAERDPGHVVVVCSTMQPGSIKYFSGLFATWVCLWRFLPPQRFACSGLFWLGIMIYVCRCWRISMSETKIGKGIELRIYNKNLQLDKLTGTNKAYIEKHLPHLMQYLVKDIRAFDEFAELVLIVHPNPEIVDWARYRNPRIKIFDLVRVNELIGTSNYEGISW